MLDSLAPFVGSDHVPLSESVAVLTGTSTATKVGSPLDASQSAFQAVRLPAQIASQTTATEALMPLGLSLGLTPAYLIGIFPSVNGHFFVPGYPTLLTAIQFDRTGTTRIGKYVLNHRFLLPGIVTTIASGVAGLLLQSVLL